MEWLKAWILQLVGVIFLSGICDMIMTDGEMKKYAKPVLGIILIFTIIRPITSLSVGKLNIDILDGAKTPSYRISQNVSEMQTAQILDTYEKKLSDKIEQSVYSKYGLSSYAKAIASTSVDKVGEIDKIEIAVKASDGEAINTEGIKKYIAEEFGISKKNVHIRGDD